MEQRGGMKAAVIELPAGTSMPLSRHRSTLDRTSISLQEYWLEQIAGPRALVAVLCLHTYIHTYYRDTQCILLRCTLFLLLRVTFDLGPDVSMTK